MTFQFLYLTLTDEDKYAIYHNYYYIHLCSHYLGVIDLHPKIDSPKGTITKDQGCLQQESLTTYPWHSMGLLSQCLPPLNILMVTTEHKFNQICYVNAKISTGQRLVILLHGLSHDNPTYTRHTLRTYGIVSSFLDKYSCDNPQEAQHYIECILLLDWHPTTLSTHFLHHQCTVATGCTLYRMQSRYSPSLRHCPNPQTIYRQGRGLQNTNATTWMLPFKLHIILTWKDIIIPSFLLR